MAQKLDFSTVDLPTLLSDSTVQQLLDIAQAYPDLSIQQMITHHPLNVHGAQGLTYEQARVILFRLHLSTVARRRLRQSNMTVLEKTDNTEAREFVLTTFPNLVDYLKYRRRYHRIDEQTQAS